jgi:hypothetical protein
MTLIQKKNFTNNASSSDLIIMDTQTGGWKYVLELVTTIQIINEL